VPSDSFSSGGAECTSTWEAYEDDVEHMAPRNVCLKETGTLVPKFHGGLPSKRQLRLVLAGKSPSSRDVPLYSFLRSVAEDKNLAF